MPKEPKTIDEYIEQFPADVQAILKKLRAIIAAAAPAATEEISYRMPAFKLNGQLAYFAAFKKHIGFYPPVRGDATLLRAVAPYANDKGNLQFLYAEPIPYPLIKRIIKARVKALAPKKGKS